MKIAVTNFGRLRGNFSNIQLGAPNDRAPRSFEELVGGYEAGKTYLEKLSETGLGSQTFSGIDGYREVCYLSSTYGPQRIQRMTKLVVMALNGDFEHGFDIKLEIGEENAHPLVRTLGKLPPFPEVSADYDRWQLTYRNLESSLRIKPKPAQVTNVRFTESCYNSAQMLSHSLNTWLKSELFLPIWVKLCENLTKSDEIRVIIQTEDNRLRRLPWHLWDFIRRYPKTEVALSAPEYEPPVQLQIETHTEQLKILAILGNSAEIDVQKDKILLQQLPDAEITFLVEPQRKEINEQLWNQPWDILFFAGHSSSQMSGETGRIYINQTDSLGIAELEHSLSTAIRQGLKMAIFNSCDGLGLAHQLQGLHIPQIIVMREPVPDVVAQEFLKHFLTAFSDGKPLYLAVREAREKLQGIEDQFPCASWLPVICQNPAVMPLMARQPSPPRQDNQPKLRSKSIHCINPDCPRPYPQAWENLSCESCRTPLRLRNRYTARQRLGTKGLATLYKVWDHKDKTERVLKVLGDTSLKAQELFVQEAAMLARLHHPGIPQAPDSFKVAVSHPQHRMLSCLVMEKIKGQTLKDIIDQHPYGCPETWALDWLKQAVDILGELHKSKIVHGNIKPSNLMLRQETGQLVITDLSAAKHISSPKSKAQSKSTQVICSNYSPTELMVGGATGPSADFCALGRTFIHLFTGKSPEVFADPLTGELRWRHYYPLIGQALADILDDMVCLDVCRCSTTAAEIQARLTKISLQKKNISPQLPPQTTISTPRGKNSGSSVSASLQQAIKWIGEVWRYTWIGGVCRDTGQAMVIGAIGASVGAGIGFMLYYWAPVGTQIAILLSQLAYFLSLALPFPVPNLGKPEILMFGLAGLGTALGLMKSGSFGQDGQSGAAQWMGVFGYLVGWLSLQLAAAVGIKSLVTFSVIATAVLTLGLSLPSHFLVHTFVAAMGTFQVFEHLITSNIGFPKVFFNLFFGSTVLSTSAHWSEFWSGITFFSFLGSNLGFWLGVSSYCVVPCLRFLGWR